MLNPLRDDSIHFVLGLNYLDSFIRLGFLCCKTIYRIVLAVSNIDIDIDSNARQEKFEDTKMVIRSRKLEVVNLRYQNGNQKS